MAALAQWEVPTESQPQAQQQRHSSASSTQPEKEYKWAAYLGDVVPVVDGEVVWERTFTNEASADVNYEAMLKYMNEVTHDEHQTEQSLVALVNKAEHTIAARMEEWLVFSTSFISLDRTRLIYTLTATCSDGAVTVKAFRLHYLYGEQQNKETRYAAEEWITDKYALNKKKTRLLPHSGKFRRTTVDRMEELMKNFELRVKATK